jgi:hypothetical protein
MLPPCGLHTLIIQTTQDRLIRIRPEMYVPIQNRPIGVALVGGLGFSSLILRGEIQNPPSQPEKPVV